LLLRSGAIEPESVSGAGTELSATHSPQLDHAGPQVGGFHGLDPAGESEVDDQLQGAACKSRRPGDTGSRQPPSAAVSGGRPQQPRPKPPPLCCTPWRSSGRPRRPMLCRRSRFHRFPARSVPRKGRHPDRRRTQSSLGTSPHLSLSRPTLAGHSKGLFPTAIESTGEAGRARRPLRRLSSSDHSAGRGPSGGRRSSSTRPTSGGGEPDSGSLRSYCL
jgi:hypothetical protein